MNILVTGGTGFIGSHTCVALLQAGHSVIIVDNLSNSRLEVVEKIEQISNESVLFYELDVADELAMRKVFENHSIDGVIHFAGYKAVGESVAKPLMYYSNNLNSTMTLAKLCIEYNVNRFVFSSSATVYGDNISPYNESLALLPTTNPYGETKAMSERILTDVAKAYPNFAVTLLRYFNPVGAHESGLIGEAPNGIPNNLMPYITKVAKGELAKLNVFGNDYNTIDGTGVRDYIHVMDLAEGHVTAIEQIESGVEVYNLGTGKGTSVLQLITAFEKANGLKIPYDVVERRQGDLAEYYADTSKVNNKLNWYGKRTIMDMCRDAWRFESKNLMLNKK